MRIVDGKTYEPMKEVGIFLTKDEPKEFVAAYKPANVEYSEMDLS